MSISIEDRVFIVAPDIKGLRLPMPPPLEWVNAYFLRDDQGWYMIDSGYNSDESRAILKEMIANHLDGLPIIGMIVTHYHPDHSGQAGWVCQEFDCPLYMTHVEWLLGRLLSKEDSPEYHKVVNDYYLNAGTPQEIRDVFKERGNSFLRTADVLPAQYKQLEQGNKITIGDRTWEIIVGKGHSPAMLLMYDREGKLLVSGDQVVSRITPNISIWPFDQDDDPLKDFLEISADLPKMVPNDVTILPGHGRPFDDFHSRIGTYIPFHENRLNKLRAGLTGELQSLHELVKVLFVRDLSPRDYVFAIGETHSHINYLIGLGEMERVNGDKIQFRRI